MCRELRSLRQSIAAFAGTFDARRLTAARAGDVVKLCAQIEASAASIKALAAARAAEGKTWERDGYRSAAEQLADQAGMSPGAAKRALETGRRMAEQPEVASAALAGELSLEQATAVSDGVAANPSKASELIERAKQTSLPELNEEVAKVKAAATDQEQRRRERHAKRSLRRWTDRDGALQVHLYGHPEDGASLWRMLDPVRRRLNMLRREAGAERDTFEGLDYDALMTIASIAAGRGGELTMADLLDIGLFPQVSTDQPVRAKKKLAGRPAKVMIRVDFAALMRGVAIEGELCEIAGYGPVPVSVVEKLLETENPFIVGIVTKGEAVVGTYHRGRRPNAHQKSALDFLYPVCAVLGCSSSTCDDEHREEFSRTKITAFDYMDRLCRHHHWLKTHKGWALVEGIGKREFVPPDDPRHPRFARGRDPTEG